MRIAVNRSEIDAAETPRLSRCFWTRTLDYLKLLAPEQAVKLLFPNGVPNGVESSIYGAASRKRMRVSVYMRGAAVYICNNSPIETNLNLTAPSTKHCPVCGAPIQPKPGTGSQFVCAGTRKKKSECQKVLRYSREHGVSIEEARQLRNARKEGVAAD